MMNRRHRLAGFGYHARDEYIAVDSIVPLTEIGKQ